MASKSRRAPRRAQRAGRECPLGDMRSVVCTRGAAVLAILLGLVAGSPAARVRADVPSRGQHAARLPSVPVDRDVVLRAVHRAKLEMIWQEARQRLAEARQYRAATRRAGKAGGRGQRAKPAPEFDRVPDDAERPTLIRQTPASRISGTTAIPANVQCNNTAGDFASSTQAEVAVGALGENVLVAWNDGAGFGPVHRQSQGYGYSTDGGATFTDGEFPPIPGPGLTWYSDPSVSVNEQTGDFYYCGLVADSASRGATTNGIGVVRARFSGNTILWDAPHLPELGPSTGQFFDKQWIAADSSSGNLYLTYTIFGGGNGIAFRRSTDGGVTWGPRLMLSSITASGRVQGSRPAVGPGGEVYATWYEAGPLGADVDYFRIRESTTGGLAFGLENTVASFYSNFGTGAPGFNRINGFHFPSIAVDRTTGPQRGRVYVAWNESANWYDDLGAGPSRLEVENNNAPESATPFTVGEQLRGGFATNTDDDWWSFNVTQGTTCIFWCDSIPTSLYVMRVLCDDGTRLALSGDPGAPAGGNGFIVWTAPKTGTYYLRMIGFDGGSPGGYHVLTNVDSPSAGERGRDQRDAFVARSDDGVSWNVARVNDEAALFDDWLPEVAVAADGMPYVIWMDWRDNQFFNCAGSSHTYVSRSRDGGVTWDANQRITSARTDWTYVLANLAPNQGDYLHLTADTGALHPVWTDGRLGSPDAWTAGVATGFSVTAGRPDTTVTSGRGFDVVLPIPWSITNLHPSYENSFIRTHTNSRNWPSTLDGTDLVPPLGTVSPSLALTVPDSAAAGPDTVTLITSNLKHTIVQQSRFVITVERGTVGVAGDPLVFFLHPGAPNPARGPSRITFALPRAGQVRLSVYGLRGERVRTLVDGGRPAGLQSVTWDGRDDAGREVGAGAYFCRLEGFGQSAVQRVVRLP